jgi:hypothetical protein
LTSWLEPLGAAGVQDCNNLSGEKSLASYDVANRLVASYVLNLPLGRNRRFLRNLNPALNRIVGGWTMDGINIFNRTQFADPGTANEIARKKATATSKARSPFEPADAALG